MIFVQAKTKKDEAPDTESKEFLERLVKIVCEDHEDSDAMIKAIWPEKETTKEGKQKLCEELKADYANYDKDGKKTSSKYSKLLKPVLGPVAGGLFAGAQAAGLVGAGGVLAGI